MPGSLQEVEERWSWKGRGKQGIWMAVLHCESTFSLFSGVFHLHQGDILSVIIPRARAKLNLSPHGTFLGFVKL